MPDRPQSLVAFPDELQTPTYPTSTFHAGEALVEEGDATDHVLIIIDGTARVSAGVRGHDLAELGPGSIVGEVAALAGGSRTATVRAASDVTVRLLTRTQFQDLLDENPDFAEQVTREASARFDRRHMLEFLEQHFGHLEPEVVAEFEEAMEWVTIRAGETLFAIGDHTDSAFFLIAGRLEEWALDAEGASSLVREITRDQIVGEVGLFHGTSRETTVVAARDSRLVRVKLDQYMSLVNRHPAALVPLISRLTRRSDSIGSKSHHRTISICVAADVDTRVFTSRLVEAIEPLGTTQHLWAARADAMLGRNGISQSSHPEPGDMRVAGLIHEQELQHTIPGLRVRSRAQHVDPEDRTTGRRGGRNHRS